MLTRDAAEISLLSGQLGYSMAIEETEKQIALVSSTENDVAYVATDHHGVIGWIHVFYAIRLESAPFCEIGGLVVDERHRGQGVGKMLIESAKPWCLAKKCKALRVRSNITRTGAHRFYEGAGFRETKQQKVFEVKL